jgi:hypothetical protein
MQTRLELCAMAGRLHPVPGQGEVLTDRTKTGEKRLRALRIAKTLHVTLTPTARHSTYGSPCSFTNTSKRWYQRTAQLMTAAGKRKPW